MATKTFKVSLSLDNPRIIQSGINVHSFDKQSIKITIELTKNSQVYQIPTGAQIKISLLKLARQEQKIILDVPFTSADSIDWIVPDYLDGYQGEVRVGIYLIVGTENIDVGYFNITSSVSDIDSAAEEFTESVMQGWDQIEADLAGIRDTITQVNTLASDFTTDVATKQADVTSKYNAFDTSVTTANQTIDDILALQPQFQAVIDETTGKDVISAPEIILARNGKSNLKTRLDDEHAQVTAQLADIPNQLRDIKGVQQAKRKPVVTFITDDGERGDWDKLKPLSETYGIPFVAAIISDTSQLKQSEILYLQNSLNWEIASHTRLQENLTLKTEVELEEALRTSKEILIGRGYNVKNIVYPGGVNDEKVRRIAKKYYRCGVEVGGGVNTGVISSFRIKRVALGSYFDFPTTINGHSTNTLEYYKYIVDEAIAKNGWVVFMLHPSAAEHDATQHSYLEQTIQYIKNKNVEILTLDKAYEVFGNAVEVGDYVKGTDGYALSFDGQQANFPKPNLEVKGLNSYAGTTLITDYPSNKVTMFTIDSSGSTGYPTSDGLVITYKTSGNSLDYQIFHTANKRDCYMRYVKIDGVWSDWVSYVWRVPAVTTTLSFGLVPANSTKLISVNVNGINNGDSVIANPQGFIENGIIFSAYIEGTNTVIVRVANITTSPITVGERLWKITVLKN